MQLGFEREQKRETLAWKKISHVWNGGKSRFDRVGFGDAGLLENEQVLTMMKDHLPLHEYLKAWGTLTTSPDRLKTPSWPCPRHRPPRTRWKPRAAPQAQRWFYKRRIEVKSLPDSNMDVLLCRSSECLFFSPFSLSLSVFLSQQINTLLK